MNDFDVLNQMSKRGLDIKAATDVTGMNKDKRGGIIKVGVDAATFQQVALSYANGDGQYGCILYIVNMKQFNEIKSKTN
jgi:hypothetical protein